MNFWIAWPFPPACIPTMLTHKIKKHQLQREPCSFFMQAHFLSSWVALYVTVIFQLSPCFLFCNSNLCYYIYMMLLLYFRPVTGKKTPLLRNHSICSGPQRFPFVLIILLFETSISTGLAIWSHSELISDALSQDLCLIWLRISWHCEVCKCVGF